MQKIGKKTFIFNLQGKEATFEVDSFPLRTEKSVLCRYGDTTILTTLCTKSLDRKPDFLRLTVFVNEKFYSIGKISSNFDRREGRPSYESIVVARLIDRALRSCLSLDDRKEIQITNMILSIGEDYEPRLAAFWSSFLVCLLSEELSLDKLMSIVILAENNNSLVYNPSPSQLEKSLFEIIVVASKEKIITLEMYGQEINEETVEQLIRAAHLQIVETIEKCFANLLTGELLEKKRLSASLRKQEFAVQNSVTMPNNDKQDKQITEQIKLFLRETISDKSLLWNKKKILLEEFPLTISKEFPGTEMSNIEIVYNELLQGFLVEWMNENKVRIDGRKFDQLRELSMNIDYVPAVHGSSFFSRGNTSVISIVTLKKGSERQFSDGLRTSSKPFIHHYNFPSFAVNETSPAKTISRREIGHGQLVEKTFFKLLPPPSEFPYITRVVSEVVSSEGSSSQASICASSLAMMATGFPLLKHVAGVSLGLIADNLITDINDFEDKFGQIDFKIAGTEDGICSLQLDVKNEGIDFQLLSESLKRARDARLMIIKVMKNVIDKPRRQLSPGIMKFQKLYLGMDRIGNVVGFKGKNIDFVSSTTGAHIDIKEDGFAFVYHTDREKLSEAIEMLRKLAVRQLKFI